MSAAPPAPSILAAGLERHRLVPVVTLDDPGDAVPLVRALTAGGLPVAEVTFRTPAGADALRAITDAGLTEPGGNREPFLLGAGTVTSTAHVDSAAAAGAQFVISPGLNRAIVERCAEHGVLAVPGVATATELQTALNLGLRVVKFFPAESSGGAPAIRALTDPFPQLRFIPTGGIDGATMHHYLSIPAVLAVGGSWMAPTADLSARDFDAVTAKTAAAVASVDGGPA